MNKKLIVANWKLNPPTPKEAKKLALGISTRSRHKAVLCPPTIFLSQVKYPNLGAQDCFWADRGAFTGQTGPVQLKALKVKYCIVGHSEKRALGETDEMINAKVRALLLQKITPIVCVGFGTKVEQDDLEVAYVLKDQLDKSLYGVDGSQIIVAYEPVWAIGSGKNASPDHAEKMAILIKTKYGAGKVLYGGSSNVFNAKEFLSQQHIDGLLVGGDSLIAGHFNEIINMSL